MKNLLLGLMLLVGVMFTSNVAKADYVIVYPYQPVVVVPVYPVYYVPVCYTYGPYWNGYGYYYQQVCY